MMIELTSEVSGDLISAGATLAIALAGGWFSLVWRNAQTRRLDMEQRLHRETHNLSLFQVLAEPNPSLQLAAAAVLIERLKAADDGLSDLERQPIVRALLSITKQSSSRADGESTASPELLKFIADNVMRVLGAVQEDKKNKKQTGKKHEAQSPLKGFDLQEVKFREAFLPKLDAREIDFYEADFSRSSLRGADFSNAVLNRANLAKTVMEDCVLVNADLRNANLCGARLKGAKLGDGSETVRLDGAQYDDHTVFPDGFEVPSCMKRVETSDV